MLPIEELKSAIENACGESRDKGVELIQKKYDEIKSCSMDQTQDETSRKLNIDFSITVAFRSLALDNVLRFNVTKDDQTEANLLGVLLDLSIDCCLCELAPPAVPFLILEDIFECQPIFKCKLIWNLLESRKSKLLQPLFMPQSRANAPSRLSLLRIANGLLRRLSSTHDTAFCGKVSMFLAWAFPLAERSALNIPGNWNKGNSTDFDTEDVFDSMQSSREDLSSLDMKTNEGSNKSKTPIDYNMYRTFWQLQQVFSSPTKATASVASWKSYLSATSKVLSALEGNALKSVNNSNRNTDPISASNQDDNDDEYFVTKYLTSNSLLSLQLEDPSLHRHVLLQCLILFQHIERLPSASLKMNTGMSGGKASFNVDPKVTLEPLKKRVLTLLRSTPPDGEKFTESVTRSLEREAHWIRWKEEKCYDFSKSSLDATQQVGSKRKQPSSKGVAGEDIMQKRLKRLYLPSKRDLKLDTANLTGNIPEHNQFLQRMEYWCEPDAGIEEEYNPNNNQMYCWSGLRLLSQNNIDCVDGSFPGNLEECVRTWKKLKPYTEVVKEKEVQPKVNEEKASSIASNEDESMKVEAKKKEAEDDDSSKVSSSKSKKHSSSSKDDSKTSKDGSKSKKHSSSSKDDSKTSKDDSKNSKDGSKSKKHSSSSKDDSKTSKDDSKTSKDGSKSKKHSSSSKDDSKTSKDDSKTSKDGSKSKKHSSSSKDDSKTSKDGSKSTRGNGKSSKDEKDIKSTKTRDDDDGIMNPDKKSRRSRGVSSKRKATSSKEKKPSKRSKK